MDDNKKTEQQPQPEKQKNNKWLIWMVLFLVAAVIAVFWASVT